MFFKFPAKKCEVTARKELKNFDFIGKNYIFP